MSTYLDAFRESYTINWVGELNSSRKPLLQREEDGKTVDDTYAANGAKMLMWIPIISHVIATLFFIDSIKEIRDKRPSPLSIMMISRAVFAVIVPPLLIPIDLVGTLVKLCIDAVNARKAKTQPAPAT